MLGLLTSFFSLGVSNWSLLKGLFKVIASMAGLFATLGGILWAFVDFQGGLSGIAAAIDAAALTVRTMPVTPMLGFVNRVLPLNEFIVFELTILFAFVACTIVRFVKSVIPSIN